MKTMKTGSPAAFAKAKTIDLRWSQLLWHLFDGTTSCTNGEPSLTDAQLGPRNCIVQEMMGTLRPILDLFEASLL